MVSLKDGLRLSIAGSKGGTSDEVKCEARQKRKK